MRAGAGSYVLMPRQLVSALLALLIAVLLAPAAAPASSGQVMTFEAPDELLDDAAREGTLDVECTGLVGCTPTRAGQI